MLNAVLRINCMICVVRQYGGLRAKRRFLGFARKILDHDYGQNGNFWDLPVNAGTPLRAKSRFLGFARKSRSSVTGKTAISEICP